MAHITMRATSSFLPSLMMRKSSSFTSPLLFSSLSKTSTWTSSIRITSVPSLSSRFTSSSASAPGTAEAQSLIEREYFAKVRRRLEADARKKISYQEFEDICSKEGLNKQQAKQLSQSLSDSGLVLHFGNSSNAALRDNIYLKPADFNKTVSRILAELSDDTYLRHEVATKQAELAKLKEELKPMEATLENLEHKASTRAKTIIIAGLGYCVVQAALVARLTWWELSWDVMEPVTYMLTFATALIGYSYFVMTGSEYTYEGLKKTLERRKLVKLIRSNNFDIALFNKLKNAVLMRENEVNKLLVDIQSDPITLHLKDSSQPVV